MNFANINHPVEQALVARTLTIGAKHASESVERYTHWMLAGFGAGFVYLVGQTAFKIPDLRSIALLFAAALLVSLVQRYIAMIVETGVGTAQEIEKLHEAGIQFDIARFLILYIDSTPVISRFAAAWPAEKMLKGDMTAAARGLFYCVMVQSSLAFISSLLLVRAFYLAVMGA
jgi:hypothetical protein